MDDTGLSLVWLGTVVLGPIVLAAAVAFGIRHSRSRRGEQASPK